MLLLIDAGNTRVKWALTYGPAPHADPAAAAPFSAAPGWIAEGAVVLAGVGELHRAWRGMPIARVLISNVAGAGLRLALEEQLELATRDAAAPAVEWFASTPACAGLRNGYRQPTQLGADRFASAIGARALFEGSALLVVGCGTATTIDVVGAAGDFIGGMILPGLDTMALALAANTAQLPQVDSRPGQAGFADNTVDAIRNGCLAAQVGAIEGAFQKLVDMVMADAGKARQTGQVEQVKPSGQIGPMEKAGQVEPVEQAGQARRSGVSGPSGAPVETLTPVICLLSGGASERIASQLAIPCRRVPNLVLTGLNRVALEPVAP
jgi:type III pantothenate kinase